MKIMDEKGRLFGVLNIIDLLIILFAAVVASVVIMFLSANSTINKAQTENKITIEVLAVEKDLCDAMKVDKKIYDRVQNKSLGTLVDVRVKPAEEYNISLQTGEHIKSAVPNRYNVELDINTVSSEDLYVGKIMSVETKDFTAAGYIIKKETKE